MGVIILDPGKNSIKGIKLNNYELENVLMLKSKTEKRQTFAGYEDSAKAGRHQIDIPEVGKYLVGDGIENYNAEYTKVNNHFKVCIITSIALLANQGESIDLIIGCPSSDYSNTATVHDYKNMIPCKKMSVVLNDELKVVDIRSVSVYPEGMLVRARMRCKKQFPNKEIINCIDIGGYNTNLRQYDRSGNLLKSVSLNNAGINSLEVMLRDELKKVVDNRVYNIDAFNISEAIKNGYIAGLDSFNNDIYTSTEEFLKLNITNYIETSILDKLMSRNIDLKSKGYLNALAGGGSLIVKQYMSDILRNNFDNIYFAEDPQYENIASYLARFLVKEAKSGALTMDQAQSIAAKLLNQSFSDNIDVGISSSDAISADNLTLDLNSSIDTAQKSTSKIQPIVKHVDTSENSDISKSGDSKE